jgi:hypothetical protein
MTLSNVKFAEEIKFDAYGVRFEIRVTDREAIRMIRRVLPFYSTELDADAPVDRCFSLVWNIDDSGEDALYDGDTEVARRADTQRLTALLDTCVRMAIGEDSPNFLLIHAGVVGWHSRAMVFPANSYSGKTTLVAELVKRGAVYYSDEYAVIDEHGQVHPYPKPLSMRKAGEYQQTDIDVAEFNGVQGTEPLCAGLVLLTAFEKEADWAPERLTEGRAVLELIPFTLSIRKNTEFALKVLNLIAKDAIILSSKRGEISDVVDLILNFSDSHILT